MAQLYRILVAEDEADIRFMTCFTLRYGGFEVIEARDGAQALELAQQQVPDLILLDVKMPRLDGIEACRRIKALPTLRDVPVVFVSALGQEQEVARGEDAGATAYLLKPYVPEDLIQMVQRILAEQHQRS
jgi:CheY-like chemotaxis protein